MRRREFITLVGGAAAIPLVAGAQQPERVRRIGVLMSTAADDPVGQARITAFRQGLQKLGWAEGKNVRIDIRWAGGNADLDRKFAAELVALTPDVILATASPTVAALQGATRTVPIVFAHAVDPVGAGFVDGLARPGGNATGFVLFEYSMSAKWLELLKEVAQRDAGGSPSGPRRGRRDRPVRAIQSVAPSFRVELSPVSVRDPAEIERAVSACALGERRPDRNGEPIDYNSSRSGHHPRGPAQTAGDLLRPFLRHRGRPDLLWD
jgi:putative ABC transport system substrate-binding protein